MKCKIEGCKLKDTHKGLCQKHYSMSRKPMWAKLEESLKKLDGSQK